MSMSGSDDYVPEVNCVSMMRFMMQYAMQSYDPTGASLALVHDGMNIQSCTSGKGHREMVLNY